MNIAAEPVELGDGDRAMLPILAGLFQGGVEFGAAIECVGAFSRLDLDMLGDDIEALGGGGPRDGRALGVNAEPAAALLALKAGDKNMLFKAGAIKSGERPSSSSAPRRLRTPQAEARRSYPGF